MEARSNNICGDFVEDSNQIFVVSENTFERLKNEFSNNEKDFNSYL